MAARRALAPYTFVHSRRCRALAISGESAEGCICNVASRPIESTGPGALIGEDVMAKTNADNHQMMETSSHMGLKAPGLITFLLSFIVMMAVMFAKFFGAQIPGLNEQTQFAGLLLAYAVLALGCLLRSL